jgi:hypothetical protein
MASESGGVRGLLSFLRKCFTCNTPADVTPLPPSNTCDSVIRHFAAPRSALY